MTSNVKYDFPPYNCEAGAGFRRFERDLLGHACGDTDEWGD